jgi:hypothetical protein
MAGALFVAMARSGGDDAMAAFAGAFVPAIEAHGTRASLALLTAIGAAAGDTGDPVAESARTAVARLAGAGVAAPSWADDLARPLTAGPFTRMHDDDDTMSVLIGVFQRAGRTHAFMIVVDHEHCDAADEIYLVGGEDLPTAVAGIREGARADGVTIKTRELGAPEFRWYAEHRVRPVRARRP